MLQKFSPKFTLAAAACLLGVMASATPALAGINQRQANQQHRISKGVANGSLNAREASRLRHQQSRIARYEARSRADGPGLTRRERANIAVMQNQSSRNIYRQKHDLQRRH